MNWPHEVDGSAAQRAVDAQAHLSLEHSGSHAIAQWQAQQLVALMQWLLDKTPWWCQRLGPTVDLGLWEKLPLLSRYELQKMLMLHGAAPVPEHHGAVTAFHPAGPVGASGERVGAAGYFMSAFAQRLIDHAFYADHQRQGRNPFADHAWIAKDIPLHEGEHLTVEASLSGGTGRHYLRKFKLFTQAQHMSWLATQKPLYLTVRPDWFEVALVQAKARHEPLPEIGQILTFGTTATDSLRSKARKWLGASVRHRYTCTECGPLAFQCPRSDAHHHVAVSNVMLEVVNAAGQPCTHTPHAQHPESGRVLVTALHQYATPLVRYDTGDQAALHTACAGCGLDVPTLTRLKQNV